MVFGGAREAKPGGDVDVLYELFLAGAGGEGRADFCCGEPVGVAFAQASRCTPVRSRPQRRSGDVERVVGSVAGGRGCELQLTYGRVVKSATFDRWLRKLKDRRAIARVQVRIDRLVAGNPGDVKPVGEGISELRIAYGQGYRVYYLQEGSRLILLLCGGDKSSQQKDIEDAKRIADDWKSHG